MRPDDLAALVVKEALGDGPGLIQKRVKDVIWAALCPKGEQGMKRGEHRGVVRAGLPVETSAMTVNRFAPALQALPWARSASEAAGQSD